MAKDKRKTQPQQTRLGPEDTPRSAGNKRRKKKKNSAARITVRILVSLVAVAGLIFLIVLGKYLFELFSSDNSTAPTVIQHDTTDKENQNKVGYYLLGLLGDSEEADMDALALVCYDKQEGTMSLLQVPRNTYLGESKDFAVKHAGGVWAHPQPLTWCETCRKRVYEPEIKGKKHAVCGTKLTEKTGSAVENLIDVFNEQYSMPVDGYFIFSHDAYAKLVDALGGVTVDLERSMEVEDVTYHHGVRTLDGTAAVYYASYGEDTVTDDVARILRQRQLTAALLGRLCDRESGDVREILKTLMDGSTPIRIDQNTSVDTMVSLIDGLRQAGLAKVTAYLLPGEAVKSGSKSYYSIHTAEFLSLLSAHFNPYGRELSATDLHVEELREATEQADLRAATLDTALSEQVMLEEAVEEAEETEETEE